MRARGEAAPAWTDERRGSDEHWLRVSLRLLRRHARVALVLGAAAGLAVYLGLAVLTRQAPPSYAVAFEVRYQSGANVLTGLSSLIGRDLPSLSGKVSLETQIEILRSRNLLLGTLRRMPGWQNRPEAELEQEVDRLRRALVFEHRERTDILAVSLVGPDGRGLRDLADALLKEYHANDIRTKRAKDTELQTYITRQIAEQEQKLARLQEVIAAHRELRPLEEARELSSRRAVEAADALRREQRQRRHRRDALLDRFTERHPEVIAAGESLDAMTGIAEAPSHEALRPFLGGAEAQWAALRAEQLDDEARRDGLDDRVAALRQGIGERFRELLRAGSDPDQVDREYRLTQEIHDGLKRRLNQVELSIHGTSSDVEVLSEPAVKEQVRMASRAWPLALGAALLCALVCPFFVESLVVSIHTAPELEQETGLPTLAILPRLDAQTGFGPAAGALPLVARGSHGSDALRLLRTNLESALEYPARRMIMVASAEPGEGKSLIAANLAAIYAEMGVPTLLVDLDLRRPVLHKLLRVRRSPGVTEVLQQKTPWRRAVQIPGVDHLHLLPAGAPVDDSGALMATVDLAEMLSETREVFSVVIVDSPALLAVADAALVARRADAVVVTYALATTPARSLARALSMLATTRAEVLGVVANDMRGLSTRPSYYSYYGYRAPAEDRERRQEAGA